LDNWEDDTRRRRRFVKNPNGSSHSEATLKSSIDSSAQDAINSGNDELLKQFNTANNRFMSDFSSAGNPSATTNADQLHINDVELEQEISGPIHYTTKCKLVCSVCVVNGTLSITTNELYFEVDESDATFKKLDQSVSF
jgi:hypothetical protein